MTNAFLPLAAVFAVAGGAPAQTEPSRLLVAGPVLAGNGVAWSEVDGAASVLRLWRPRQGTAVVFRSETTSAGRGLVSSGSLLAFERSYPGCPPQPGVACPTLTDIALGSRTGPFRPISPARKCAFPFSEPGLDLTSKFVAYYALDCERDRVTTILQTTSMPPNRVVLRNVVLRGPAPGRPLRRVEFRLERTRDSCRPQSRSRRRVSARGRRCQREADLVRRAGRRYGRGDRERTPVLGLAREPSGARRRENRFGCGPDRPRAHRVRARRQPRPLRPAWPRAHRRALPPTGTTAFHARFRRHPPRLRLRPRDETLGGLPAAGPGSTLRSARGRHHDDLAGTGASIRPQEGRPLRVRGHFRLVAIDSTRSQWASLTLSPASVAAIWPWTSAPRTRSCMCAGAGLCSPSRPSSRSTSARARCTPSASRRSACSGAPPGRSARSAR